MQLVAFRSSSVQSLLTVQAGRHRPPERWRTGSASLRSGDLSRGLLRQLTAGKALLCCTGGTPQANGWMDDWVSFFAERRLKPQLAQASRPSLQQAGDKLIQNLGTFFEGIEV